MNVMKFILRARKKTIMSVSTGFRVQGSGFRV